VVSSFSLSPGIFERHKKVTAASSFYDGEKSLSQAFPF
jgi:hypothetical protein